MTKAGGEDARSRPGVGNLKWKLQRRGLKSPESVRVSESSEAMKTVSNPTRMIEKEIEAIFAGQEVVDVDGVLGAFKRLNSIATKADLPALVAAIQSPRNNFWTRELFAESISQLGGVDYLEPLFEAAQLNVNEGHDNDGLDTWLTEIAHADPERCRAKLEGLLARDDFKHREAAAWLLEFCTSG